MHNNSNTPLDYLYFQIYNFKGPAKGNIFLMIPYLHFHTYMYIVDSTHLRCSRFQQFNLFYEIRGNKNISI